MAARVGAFRIDRVRDQLDERFEQVALRLDQLPGFERAGRQSGKRIDERELGLLHRRPATRTSTS